MNLSEWIRNKTRLSSYLFCRKGRSDTLSVSVPLIPKPIRMGWNNGQVVDFSQTSFSISWFKPGVWLRFPWHTVSLHSLSSGACWLLTGRIVCRMALSAISAHSSNAIGRWAGQMGTQRTSWCVNDYWSKDLPSGVFISLSITAI